MAYALKEIKKDGVVLERLNDKINVEVAADAVVLSLGFRPDNHLVEELKEKGIHAQAIGNAVKDGTIAPASRSGFEAARKLFKTSVKTPSFITAPDLYLGEPVQKWQFSVDVTMDQFQRNWDLNL